MHPHPRSVSVPLSALTLTIAAYLAIHVHVPPVSADPTGATVLVETARAAVGIDRGVCAVVGADADILARLVVSTNCLVHVWEPDAGTVSRVRELAAKAGIGIDRLVVQQSRGQRLPYADDMLDVLVLTKLSVSGTPIGFDEALRVVRPGGVMIAGSFPPAAMSAEGLMRWAQAARGVEVTPVESASGAWVRLIKPFPSDIDSWSHWEHGPDNNPVSTDRRIRWPYMTQFLAEPHFIGMPAITTAAGGRTFLATGNIAHHEREWPQVNKLIARNGYNGTVLWVRDLPEGFLSHRSAFVATEKVFHLMDGDGCLMLDAATGRELGRLTIPGLQGEWKWMAQVDGVWYAMAGPPKGHAQVVKGDRNFGGWSWADLSPGYYSRPRVPWGFGRTLAAYDSKSNRVLWRHQEQADIDSRALAVQGNRLFLYCPGKRLRCLDRLTGKTVWTNSDARVMQLIEQPGRGLVSTPGFRSACLAVATPQALVLQGQTRMNVVAVSAADGRLLWTKKKVTNNPNVISLDEGLVMGVARPNSHVLVDPLTGDVRADLHFRKAACTRLTACPDALFVRGEGTLRYDRFTKQVLIDGAARPGCNDGALPANGMLYLGPWACDCNLQLVGAVAKCPAGNFRFPDEQEPRLEKGVGPLDPAPLKMSDGDWPMYRRDIAHSGSTPVRLARPGGDSAATARTWRFDPPKPYTPAPAVLAGGMVFVAGDDGQVRALDVNSGRLTWTYATQGAIKASPTVWEGRVYVGSGDGFVYCLEAATGRLLWRFRAAPARRLIMVYGRLTSTWPVNTGVLVHEGVAYFGAGIIDYDGTCVYAIDARTGELRWANTTCGFLNPALRKGVSAQGYMTVLGDQLLLAGGNQVNPARFDLKTGRCLNPSFDQGAPKANHGKFVGTLFGKHPLVGGRILYAAPENVANKDSFVLVTERRSMALNFGGIPPAWNDETIALMNFRNGKLTCYEAAKVRERIDKGLPPPGRPDRRRAWFGLAQLLQQESAARWATDMGGAEKFEVEAVAMCPQSVVAIIRNQNRNRARPQWTVAAFLANNGQQIWFWTHNLSQQPLPEGLLVGPAGQIVVTMLRGSVLSFGPRRPPAPRGVSVRPVRRD